MPKFNIVLTQRLDDGDEALREEHRSVDEYYVQDIIAKYAKRSMSRGYVQCYKAFVERAE